MEWKVEGRGDTFAVLDESDNEIATVPYEPLRGVDAPDSAEYRRAALIAAAPDLLEALHQLANYVLVHHQDLGTLGQHRIQIARAAIAKAKGGR